MEERESSALMEVLRTDNRVKWVSIKPGGATHHQDCITRRESVAAASVLWRSIMAAGAMANVLLLLLLGMAMEGEAAGGGWIPAHATVYGADQNPSTLGGACGYDNTMHAGLGVNTAAVSGALFRGGAACGACFRLVCDAKSDPKWCFRRSSVVVTATNFCPPNNHGGWCDPPHHHFDMSLPAFSRIARSSNEGIVPIFYTRVPCQRRGGVRFTMKGQQSFNLVMFSNVGGSGDVTAAWIRGSRSRAWVPMQRNWGANWQSGSDFRNQALSFRLTLADGKTLDFSNVAPSSWGFGQTFSSQRQFP